MASKIKKILLTGVGLDYIYSRGGVYTHIHTLLTAPIWDEFQPVVFGVGSPNYGNVDHPESPISFIQRILTMWFRFILAVLRNRPDAVHLNPSFDHKSFWRDSQLLVIARCFFIPVVMQFHGGVPARFLGSNKLLINLIGGLLSLTEQVIVPSKAKQEALSGYFPRLNIKSIPVMIDVNSFSRVNQAPENGIIRILFMSRFIKGKGIWDIVDAIPSTLEGNPNLEFHFAGDGEELSAVRKAIEASPHAGKVSVYGHVSPEIKNHLFSTCQVMILPSMLPEGLPYIIIEAMAAGMVIITCRVGSIPDVVEEDLNGFFVQPNRPDQISETIIKISSDEIIRQRISLANRAQAEKFYDTQIVSQDYAAIYHRICDRN